MHLCFLYLQIEASVSSSQTEKEFFTSFLSREDAFRLIMNCWSQARLGGEEEECEMSAGLGITGGYGAACLPCPLFMFVSSLRQGGSL